MQIPFQIFTDLMRPLDTDEAVGLKWLDDAKTDLEPTEDKKTFMRYKYCIRKPKLVDKIWALETHETKKPQKTIRKKSKAAGERRATGDPAPRSELQAFRRGMGAAKLHLSSAAEA
eukprot:3838738-Prymnesium_polylepis.1